MNAPQMRLRPSIVGLTADGSAVAGPGSDVRNEIQDTTIGLACWVRRFPDELAQAFDLWPAASLPNARFSATRLSFPSLVKAMLAPCVDAPPSARAALGADLLVLANCFCQATNAFEFECRVETVDDNSCWKFHQDNVALRLLTTYRGPGTQWVPRSRAEEAIKAQEAYSGSLYEIPRFGVALMKGSAAAGSGIVHRSPRIEGTGVVRLLVAIDATWNAHNDDCGCLPPAQLRY
jgi:hypothetical protein